MMDASSDFSRTLKTQDAEPPQRPRNVLHDIADGINKVAGAPAVAIDFLNTGFAKATKDIAAVFPALPAAAMGSLVIGIPHAHIAHPPSGPPPIPPTPLPPVGVILFGCCPQVLINNRPAARCGDLVLNPTCCGLPPLGEIKTGSSNVFIGGARAARVLDISMHCTPVPAGAAARGAAGAAKTAQTVAAKVVQKSMMALEKSMVVMQAAGMMAQVYDIAGDAVASTETDDAAMSSALALSAGMMAAGLATDAVAMAMAALMGKDPCLPPTGTPGMVTTITSPNVMIGGFPMPGWMTMAAGVLKMAKGLKRHLPKSVQKIICKTFGEPIDPVTGANFDTFVDYEDPDSPIAFAWYRSYSSADAVRDGPMGRGFRHPYEASLTFDLEGAIFTDAEGRRFEFPHVAPDAPEVARDGCTLGARREDERTIFTISRAGEPDLEFAPPPGSRGPLPPTALVGWNGRADLRYDGQGRLAAIREQAEAGAIETRFTYDRRGHLIELRRGRAGEQPLPRIAAYSYDAAGCLVAWMDALGGKGSYAYDAGRRMTRKTDRNGYSFHYAYDGDGRCVSSHGDGGLWRVALRYEKENRRTVITEADGGEWICSYDENNVLVSLRDPYGGERRWQVDGAGRVVAEIAPDGQTDKRFLYDCRGWHHSVVDRWGYIRPLLEEESDPPHRFEQGDLPDPFGQRVPETHFRQQWGHSLDSLPTADGILNDLPTSVHDAATHIPGPMAGGWQPKRRRDALGRIVEEVEASGRRQTWAYDADGNVVAYKDHDGRQYRSEIGAWNLVAAEVDPLGHRTRYSYTARTQVAGIVDPGGAESRYEYDHKDRLVRVIRHGVVREEYAYDAADRPFEKRDGSGAVLLCRTIGANGLPAECRLASGEVYRYAYDDRGQVVRVASADHEILRDFDDWGRLLSDERDGRGVRHRFDRFGLAETTYFGRFTVTYGHELAGVLTIKGPVGGVHRIRRDCLGNVIAELGNGSTVLSRYDQEARCTTRHVWRQGGGEKAHWFLNCLYSAEGELLRSEDKAHGLTLYTYDSAHRLIGERPPDGATTSIDLDAAGNVCRKAGLPHVELAEGNRLRAVDDERFLYDSRNHLAERWTSEADATRYTYDSLDMLVGIAWTGRKDTWTAGYDGLRRRIFKSLGEQRTEFWWDGDRLAAELGPSGTLRIYIYPGPDALVPLLFLDYDGFDAEPSSGRIHYPIGNQLGVPLRIENQAGEIVWLAEHVEPYGTITVDPKSSIAYARRFPGHYFDEETGLHENRYRSYSPELGRYLQSDPVGHSGEMNLYAYPPNPLADVDLLGLAGSGCRGRRNNRRRNNRNFMRRLRTRWVSEQAATRLLALTGQRRGLDYRGPYEVRGLGATPIISRTPPRRGHHTTTFSEETLRLHGVRIRSANQYATGTGLGIPDISYEILHAAGHGEIGSLGDRSANNLAVGSRGANSEMIQYDGAVTGNTNVLVDTSFDVQQDTLMAERINQRFYYVAPDGSRTLIHDHTIDAQRHDFSEDEWRDQETRVEALRQFVGVLDASRTPPAV